MVHLQLSSHDTPALLGADVTSSFCHYVREAPLARGAALERVPLAPRPERTGKRTLSLEPAQESHEVLKPDSELVRAPCMPSSRRPLPELDSRRAVAATASLRVTELIHWDAAVALALRLLAWIHTHCGKYVI